MRMNRRNDGLEIGRETIRQGLMQYLMKWAVRKILR